MSVDQPFRYSPARERISLALRRILGERNRARAQLLFRGLRYARIMDYITIDGWLAHGEAITLYETARSLPSERPVVVEIGSWLGKSSVVIARGLRGKTNPTLYCIDPFNADGDDASLGDYGSRKARLHRTLQEQFHENIAARGVADIVRPMPGYSFDVRKTFNEPIDFLFIDGNHEYEAVLQDFRDWMPLLKRGGYVAFHDVSFNNPQTGPQRVVREEILDRPAWSGQRHVQGLFLARKV